VACRRDCGERYDGRDNLFLSAATPCLGRRLIGTLEAGQLGCLRFPAYRRGSLPQRLRSTVSRWGFRRSKPVLMLGSLLIAIGIAWAVGPVRLLAGLIAVPVVCVIVAVAVLAGWVALSLHGAADHRSEYGSLPAPSAGAGCGARSRGAGKVRPPEFSFFLARCSECPRPKRRFESRFDNRHLHTKPTVCYAGATSWARPSETFPLVTRNATCVQRRSLLVPAADPFCACSFSRAALVPPLR